MKRLFGMLLAISLIFSALMLVSCTDDEKDEKCKTHVDDNFDFKCDKCGEFILEGFDPEEGVPGPIIPY